MAMLYYILHTTYSIPTFGPPCISVTLTSLQKNNRSLRLLVTFRNVMVLLRQGVVTTPLNPKVRSPSFFAVRFISYYGTHFSPSTTWRHVMPWLQDIHCRSQWPRGLRHRSTAARLLRSWVRIPPRAWMFVCCQVEVFATDWSFVQRSPTDCGASLYLIIKPRKREG